MSFTWEVLTPQKFSDERGVLRVWENLPFPVQRAFMISDVPYGMNRGCHAHKTCQQIIVCLSGNATLSNVIPTIPEGSHYLNWRLEKGDAILIPPLSWIELSAFVSDAVLMVLCSEPYRKEDMITDFKEFRWMQ